MTMRLQGNRRSRIHPFDAHPVLTRPQQLPQQLRHLRRPRTLALTDVWPGGHVAGRQRRSYFVDGVEPVREVLAPGELEQDRTVPGEYEIAGRGVAGREDLHVPAAAGISNVDGIAEDDGADAPGGHLGAHALLPVAAHCSEIDAVTFGHKR